MSPRRGEAASCDVTHVRNAAQDFDEDRCREVTGGRHLGLQSRPPISLLDDRIIILVIRVVVYFSCKSRYILGSWIRCV
jgi:hypothetical protein